MATIEPLDQFEFHQRLEETPGVALILFTSRGCSACRRWKALLTDYLAAHPGLHVFEVDAERDMALTREYEVFHLPALFLYLDGRYHCALQSEAQPARFQAALQAALNAPAEEAP